MTTRSHELRGNQTEAEKRLWAHLKRLRLKRGHFRRQAPIGPYIVDFVNFSDRFIIEVDGGQHAHREQRDKERTAWLESQGFRVIRFWNNEILENGDGVLEAICTEIENRISPPS